MDRKIWWKFSGFLVHNSLQKEQVSEIYIPIFPTLILEIIPFSQSVMTWLLIKFINSRNLTL